MQLNYKRRKRMNSAFRHCAPAAAASFVSASALLLSSLSTPAALCEEQEEKDTQQRPKLVFLGTGSSTGCPKPLCTMLFQNGSSEADAAQQEEFAGICKVSNRAIQGNPQHNKDYRNNPSLLIHHYENGDDTTAVPKNVIIDVGKTFREGALRWMPQHCIQSLDAIILTHHHMDAVAGLDDVRGFQRFSGLNHPEKPPTRIPIHVYLSQECLEQVSSQFPWLFPTTTMKHEGVSAAKEEEQPAAVVVKRDVAALDIHVIQDYVPFHAAGLVIVPLPVWHGSDLISLGFSFSITRGGTHGNSKTTNIVYISDVSKMVPETMEYIQTKLPPTDILIVDCLLPEFEHPVHYSLEQAVALSNDIQAKRTYLIGMSCDAFSPHEEMNAALDKKYGGTIQFAHDGQVVYL